MDKHTLRRKLRATRSALSMEVRASAAERVIAHIRSTQEWRDAEVVALYAATPREVSLDDLFDHTDKVLLLPRVVAEPVGLTWHRVTRAPADASPLGLREPPADAPPASPVDVDLWLIPAVAVDASGHRLGQGGGYYDRALEGVHGAVFAVVFDVQRVLAVPRHDHDRVVDAVVTESGVHRVRPDGARDEEGARG